MSKLKKKLIKRVIKQQDKENVKLQKRLDTAQAMICDLQDENSDLIEEYESALRHEREEYEEIIETKDKELKERDEELKEKDERIKKGIEETEDLKDEIEMLQMGIDDACLKLEAIKEESEKFFKELRRMKDEIKALYE